MKPAVSILKIGGGLIEDPKRLNTLVQAFANLKGLKVLVHGGGKLATQLAQQLDIPTQMVEGRRITDNDTLNIITMAYAGWANKTIVSKLQAEACNALGLSGADGNSITAVKRPSLPIDYGFVGDITSVNISFINMLLDNGITPVFCALTHDANGQLLNTNADTIASEIAIALSETHAVQLYYCFDKPGVLQDVNNPESVITHITKNTYNQLLEAGIVADGMIPKLHNCFHALERGVDTVSIGDEQMITHKNNLYTLLTLT
ncbi:acetylglutamate kinase [Imtechella halotolerans]|uniref:Acetylglutamate kinase n=1 Tax=Imtechella halotolerans K1 TaxID=946077 RepID=I0W7D8_9FLAO|nr:acetylglutamate kinase [Imtechella halotolerans]EID72304.1 acetylglutamate kinase [Imtechella halotolerans K1]WMQ64406.1 acetylglutamate kinase [Imtechella halotolerans]